MASPQRCWSPLFPVRKPRGPFSHLLVQTACSPLSPSCLHCAATPVSPAASWGEGSLANHLSVSSSRSSIIWGFFWGDGHLYSFKNLTTLTFGLEPLSLDFPVKTSQLILLPALSSPIITLVLSAPLQTPHQTPRKLLASTLGPPDNDFGPVIQQH